MRIEEMHYMVETLQMFEFCSVAQGNNQGSKGSDHDVGRPREQGWRRSRVREMPSRGPQPQVSACRSSVMISTSRSRRNR